ncbi:ribosomal RNA small subunit methyltransferase A [Candidatus Saccharibacteria bacterium]|nr:ribosomal RNA small subunit methyltransferase A [Candidatus Saccharibacteria bacterium]
MALKNKKSLGQNWLHDRPTLETIADLAADFPESALENPPRLCVEIGPGLGTLTSSLLKRFKKVLALELDTMLAENLPKSFPGKNLEVKNVDVLAFDFDHEIHEPFVVAGNIPYYITSKILKSLLSLKTPPEKIVLLVQKEVAEKLCDPRHSSSLSLYVDNLAAASLGPVVKRELFTPSPKVDSRVLVLEPRVSPKLPPALAPEVENLIKLAFSSPRKKLLKNLAPLGLSASELITLLSIQDLSPNARPSDLSLENYLNLVKTLKTR